MPKKLEAVAARADAEYAAREAAGAPADEWATSEFFEQYRPKLKVRRTDEELDQLQDQLREKPSLYKLYSTHSTPGAARSRRNQLTKSTRWNADEWQFKVVRGPIPEFEVEAGKTAVFVGYEPDGEEGT